MKKEGMKGFVSGVLVMAVLAGLVGTAAATVGKRTAELDYSNIQITLNGQKLTPTDASGNVVEPFAIDGTTYLPVRAVGNAMGLSVDWDGETRTVKLTGNSVEKKKIEDLIDVHLTQDLFKMLGDDARTAALRLMDVSMARSMITSGLLSKENAKKVCDTNDAGLEALRYNVDFWKSFIMISYSDNEEAVRIAEAMIEVCDNLEKAQAAVRGEKSVAAFNEGYKPALESINQLIEDCDAAYKSYNSQLLEGLNDCAYG